jgi:hypothetical protein
MKPTIYLTADTETVGLPPRNFVYDFGYTIHDKQGNIFMRRNFLVRDVITDPRKMMSAFYAKKIFSFYIPALDSNKIKLWEWVEIAEQLAEDIILFDVDVIAAYNARFDFGALQRTNALIGKTRRIVPRPIDRLCIWNFACNVLLNRDSYHKTAQANGWITRANNYHTTAEHTYRYINGVHDFTESHTALDDAEIETEILVYCFRQHKRTPLNELPYMPWQIAQELAA